MPKKEDEREEGNDIDSEEEKEEVKTVSEVESNANETEV